MKNKKVCRIVFIVFMLMVFSLAVQAEYPWTCSIPTDMMSCLDCAGQAFDNCIYWCDVNHQNFQGSYCRSDCLEEYNATRNECSRDFDPLYV